MLEVPRVPNSLRAACKTGIGAVDAATGLALNIKYH